MASDLTEKAIKSGLSIADAIEKFITENAVKSYITKDPSYLSDSSDIYRANAAKLPENVREGYLAFGDGLHSWVKSSKLNSLKLKLLMAKLREGKIRAYGFPVHETPGDNRVAIPAFLLHPEFVKRGWSQIIGHGRTYVDILIIRATELSIEEKIASKPKIGRPLIRDKIQEIIRKLDTEDAINPAMSVKAIGKLIFARGQIDYPAQFIAKDGKVKPGRSTIEKEYTNYRRTK